LQLGNDFGCFFAWHTPISSVCPPPGPIDLLAMAHRARCGLNTAAVWAYGYAYAIEAHQIVQRQV